MAVRSAPFFDPQLAYLQRKTAWENETQTADLRLQGQRLTEDQNLFRPFLERRFKNQSADAAASVAGRGFHGKKSGVMSKILGDLGQEQTYTAGEFERGAARQLTDIERAIANLTGQNIMQGAEGVREGADRASRRVYPDYLSMR